jgi:hypothetical protein
MPLPLVKVTLVNPHLFQFLISVGSSVLLDKTYIFITERNLAILFKSEGRFSARREVSFHREAIPIYALPLKPDIMCRTKEGTCLQRQRPSSLAFLGRSVL